TAENLYCLNKHPKAYFLFPPHDKSTNSQCVPIHRIVPAAPGGCPSPMLIHILPCCPKPVMLLPVYKYNKSNICSWKNLNLQNPKAFPMTRCQETAHGPVYLLYICYPDSFQIPTQAIPSRLN